MVSERRRSEWFSVKATNKEKRRINELNRFGLEIRLPVLARENQQRSFISDAGTSKEVFIKYHLMPNVFISFDVQMLTSPSIHI